jgi:hypothetical protein
MKIDELERLHHAAQVEPWDNRGRSPLDLWAGDGRYIGSVDTEDAARLIAAARNALPALLRVARAARELEEILATVAADADAADVLVMRRHAARAELRAALAALEGAPDA